jgi:hypothetical protein
MSLEHVLTKGRSIWLSYFLQQKNELKQTEICHFASYRFISLLFIHTFLSYRGN